MKRRILMIIGLAISACFTEIQSGQFTRGAGYWTHPVEEAHTSFFRALTDTHSQRENWYEVTPYIAEFWCTLSNIGFFLVAYRHKSPEAFFAGLASAVSHTVPRKWLHTLDLVGVGTVGIKVLREYRTAINNPWLIAPLAVAGIVNMADAFFARNYGYTWPHVVWHFTAAACMDVFLSNIEKEHDAMQSV